MEIKSAAFGGAAVLLAVGLVFGLVATANAENAPEPAITTTSVAPPATPTKEPSMSAPAPEPTVSTPAVIVTPVPAGTASINPAPAVAEPAPPAPDDVQAAPVEARPVETYMPGITVSGSGDGRVNAPADPGDIKNVHRVPMPAPTG